LTLLIQTTGPNGKDNLNSLEKHLGESETRQVSTLLYMMGENADNVLTSTRITSEDRKKYDTVLAKFDEFFKVRRNVIFERTKFNCRSKLPGETVEQYISELCALVKTCEYGNLTEEMFRDRTVVGIRDEAMSKRLQLDPELTLERAKKAATPAERTNSIPRIFVKYRNERKHITKYSTHMVSIVKLPTKSAPAIELKLT